MFRKIFAFVAVVLVAVSAVAKDREVNFEPEYMMSDEYVSYLPGQIRTHVDGEVAVQMDKLAVSGVSSRQLLASALGTIAQSVDSLGNTWTRADFGSSEANYWVNEIGLTQDPAVIEDAVSHYYTQCLEGTSNRWGDGWLSKFVANLLAYRGWTLRDKLSADLQSRLNDVLADAVDERTFRIDTTCGLDSWNSCSEDFVSFLTLVSRVKNFYPAVVEKVGINYLNLLEQKYIGLVFSTANGWYSMVRENTLDGQHDLMHNHGQQSAVYTGILLVYFNQAIRAYSLAGNQVPAYYKQDWLIATIADTFAWLQTLSTSDGVQYLALCMNYQGNLESCADVKVTNAIPQVVPSGRLMQNLVNSGVLTPNVFKEGSYSFELFDTSYTAGNVWNKGRQDDWNISNEEFQIVWEMHLIRRKLVRAK